ncbi:hypothetical protein EXD76_03710 [BEV proteobacterium]|nr:hypothetical protein [Candidatus Symbiopectobacterium sp. Chty_BC]
MEGYFMGIKSKCNANMKESGYMKHALAPGLVALFVTTTLHAAAVYFAAPYRAERQAETGFVE